MSKFADDKDGLHAYVVTTSWFGRRSDRIEYAASLAQAKQMYGWTRQLHTRITVRRARAEDVTV